jgi:hypothetical protein
MPRGGRGQDRGGGGMYGVVREELETDVMLGLMRMEDVAN